MPEFIKRKHCMGLKKELVRWYVILYNQVINQFSTINFTCNKTEKINAKDEETNVSSGG